MEKKAWHLEYPKRVQCNHCNWNGTENDTIVDDETEQSELCPKCKQGDALMDTDTQNTCDKCNTAHESPELIWIDSEDFTPKEGEHLKLEAEKYSALCEDCYQSMLEKPTRGARINTKRR